MKQYFDAMRIGGPALPGFDDDHVTRIFLSSAFFLIAFFFVTTPAWLMDPRMLGGDNVWLKPQKFNISLAVHFLTLAILARMPPRPVRAGPVLSVFAVAAMGAMLLEEIYVSIQAARARMAPFNVSANIRLTSSGEGESGVLAARKG